MLSAKTMPLAVLWNLGLGPVSLADPSFPPNVPPSTASALLRAALLAGSASSTTSHS